MTLVRKIFKSFTLLILFIFFIISLIYFLLVYRPENIISVANKVLDDNYFLEFESIESESKFLSPTIILKDFLIINKEKKEIISIDEVNLDIKILKSLTKRYIHLDNFSLKNIQFLDDIESENSKRIYKLKINNIFISSNDAIFSSKETTINSANGNLLISNRIGYLNDIPYKEVNIFKKIESPLYFYSANFELKEDDIEKEELVDLNQFSEKNINLNLVSKGYFDSAVQEITSINKYVFFDTKLVTQSGFEINDINGILYTNMDEKLSGVFSAEIPDQRIDGSIKADNKNISLRSKIKLDMNSIFNYGQYLELNGKEEFDVRIDINEIASLELTSNLENTLIRSNINDLNKDLETNLETTILISDMSKPTYHVENKKFKTFIDENNNGYFAFGSLFNDDIDRIKNQDGFYIFLDLKELNIDNFFLSNQAENNSNLKSIKLIVGELNLFDNIYFNQNFEINLLPNETLASFSGKNLNGNIRIDSSGFIRIDVFDTKFDFQEVDTINQYDSFQKNNINLRFVGNNVKAFDDVFKKIDFYLLRNEKITTFDNINISSTNFNIKPFQDNEKAYISYNNKNNLYKIRGSYEINNKNNVLGNLINYNFGYLYTDLNVQWVSLQELKDLEGQIKFKIKDFESKKSLPDSAFLRALKILNLNSIIGNLNNDSNLRSSNLIINRAEGDLYIGKNRALISKSIKLETAEAKMSWSGEIIKNTNGLLDELDLDLEMRLKVSENIPWYAAIFGGIPALAGGFVFENIIDERLDDVSTFQFDVIGSVSDPVIIRLDKS